MSRTGRARWAAGMIAALVVLVTTKAFSSGGTKAAKEAWKVGAAKTKRAAHEGAEATKKAAQ